MNVHRCKTCGEILTNLNYAGILSEGTGVLSLKDNTITSMEVKWFVHQGKEISARFAVWKCPKCDGSGKRREDVVEEISLCDITGNPATATVTIGSFTFDISAEVSPITCKQVPVVELNRADFLRRS